MPSYNLENEQKDKKCGITTRSFHMRLAHACRVTIVLLNSPQILHKNLDLHQKPEWGNFSMSLS